MVRQTFIQNLQMILEPQDLNIHNLESARVETNTLLIERSVLGVVYPRTIEQLNLIVKAAAKYQVALYPVSQGKNIGYGEMTPTTADQLVVGLKYLNKIREYDSQLGEVVIEPGVTQAQLAEYLESQNSKFWADMTGATPEASLIGNTLEAGFGHTPIGDHRKHILQMEVMLANGEMVRTAEMPAIGPDLAQLFVQSNFGIVTAMRIPLFLIPEETVTFTVSFQSDEQFFQGIQVLAELRRDGTITSLAHTGNSTRALMTSSRFPAGMDRSQVLSEKECQEILNANSPIDFGAWSCVGGLYGFKTDVRAKQKRMRKALKGLAQVRFFTDGKMERTHRILNSGLMKKFRSLDFMRSSFSSLRALHGILRGQPSQHPSQNIFWRVDKFENLGLMWHAPVIPATAKDCAALLKAARQVFHQYHFEMPVTLTLINAKHMTAVFNISYDKLNPEETVRAHAAYQALSLATYKLGYLPYRVGLMGHAIRNYDGIQFALLQAIKRTLDPKNILAPGRYGLDGDETRDQLSENETDTPSNNLNFGPKTTITIN